MTFIIELKGKKTYRVKDDFAKQIKDKWVKWRELPDSERVKKNSVLDLETFVGSLSDIKSIYKDDQPNIDYNESEVRKAEIENREWADPKNVRARKEEFAKMRLDLEKTGFFNTDK